MTALGVLHQILFVDVSPPASLFDSSLRHDVLSLSDVTPGLRLDLPVSGGLVEDDHHAWQGLLKTASSATLLP